MADTLLGRVVQTVQATLRMESGRDDLTVSPEDSMETIPEWDSLNFMKVFLSINETFGIDPDFDEAIHYTSIDTLTAFLREEVA